MRSIRFGRLASVALAACVMAFGAGAQNLDASVTLYGWLPGLDADVESSRGGISATTSVSAGNVLEALNFAFMAAGDVHYGRFGILQDLVYADLGTSGDLSGPLAAEVHVDTNLLISTTAVGYRAYQRDGWLVSHSPARAIWISSRTSGPGAAGRSRWRGQRASI